MDTITYDYAMSTIAFYANDVLYLFADKWNRWPAGSQAEIILSLLADRQAQYEAIGGQTFEYAADELNKVRCAILSNLRQDKGNA